jgi:hypothetical protein
MHRMRAIQEDREQPVQDSLWAEALWGIGLIGGVLAFAALLVTVFGH